MKTERYGNCLFGALTLMARFRTFRVRADWKNRVVPHLYVLDERGRKWHFRVVRDVMPDPLCYFVFVGKFARMR